MKKKYAFLLMGSHYDPERHCAVFEAGGQTTCICTVRSLDEARDKALALAADGVGAIELCGAFSEENAQALIDLTRNQVAVGFCIHKREQDGLFSAFFSDSGDR
ncbi:hypothetical protein GMD88_07590 [Pseudoflavonifractor sp. BIOML-A6]|jgi:hypothetical protein fulcA4_08219|nr:MULTISPECIES: DUF6506 family protein [unclassified Pseudoflavonifractor]MTQ97056.1 hypothetical protein [Pseudoflavonifractor sp. BIOML-A16]MTR06122.1 hypothetical protein [Pseudoflavonifractor sp. BIOML-A15]MTR33687.1 hypothetical protein [Pseudoflavonifractor sp. BIOML-A14]MTR72814.1 hypothetical protein [Pseudoflavonifractor sp. BIOML-A18]MTS63285.1 hypothetical protein [Pseudoflavonifractor sp. BIOML-A5]MTS70906.1 hypothetical protein [Pseudoflavonifractor sp. BIOML-A8]MTS90327.1 hypo